MKPVFQTKFGGASAPEEEQGDCLVACLTSIFEVGLEDGPDLVGSIIGGGWFYKVQSWLAGRNLSLLLLPGKPCDIPIGYAIAVVNSHTLPGEGHVVVVLNGKPVHDPNPNTAIPYEQSDITDYWAFTVRDPSLQKNLRNG